MLKDKQLSCCLVVWGILGALSDYYYFGHPYEFPIRQFCLVLLFSLWAIDKRGHAYSYVILCGLTALNITAFIKELRHANHEIEMSQVVVSLIILAGICVGLMDVYITNALKKRSST